MVKEESKKTCFNCKYYKSGDEYDDEYCNDCKSDDLYWLWKPKEVKSNDTRTKS